MFGRKRIRRLEAEVARLRAAIANPVYEVDGEAIVKALSAWNRRMGRP